MNILGLFSIPDAFIWIILVLVAIYLYSTWPFSTLSAYGYKGPRAKPFIGNIDKVMMGDFFGSYDLKGKELYGKVYAMYEGRQPTLVCFDTDVLKQVLVKDFSSFVDRRKMYLRGKVKYSILDLTGSEWKRVRNLQTPFFSSGKLKRNIESLKYCVNNLNKVMDKHAEKSEAFDPKTVTGAFTLEAIALTAFGLEIDSQNHPDHVLFKVCQEMMTISKGTMLLFMSGFIWPGIMPLLEIFGVSTWPKGSMELITEMTLKAIEERKKSHKDRPDFIQAMIKAHDAELEAKQEENPESRERKGLTEDEIVAQASLFILAGYDTVSTATSFLMFCLANNQDCQAKVYEEIEEVFGDGDMTYDKLKQNRYLDMCFDESLRLYPPAFRTDRSTLEDITINGYFIPKDTLVILPIYGLNHDPELWTDPEKYDPERFSEENKKHIDPYAYLPFGAGPRNCVGMRLAQIEVKMAVIMTIKNYKLTVSDKMQLPLQLDSGFFPKAKGGIWLNVEKRKPSK